MTRRHRSTRTLIGALLCFAGLVGLGACGDDGDGTASPTSDTQVGSTAPTTGGSTPPDTTASTEPAPADETPSVTSVVAASVHEPIVLLPRPGDDGHLWLAERAGRVRRLAVADGGDTLTVVGDDVVDITSETTTDAERGLLGMAFSADGDELYLSYTDVDGNSRVIGVPMDGDEALVAERRTLFTVDQPFANHNGGGIVLGPDGALWLGMGDGGAADDPENRAQNPSTPLGKMVRIDLESGDDEIVASGLRNPWRFAFDTDGGLWIADVGQNDREEINRVAAQEIDGANFGWSGYEGTAPYLDGEGRRPEDPVMPVFEYTHDNGNCSITGGLPYAGEAIDGLQGAFVFADYCAGRVRAIVLGADGALDREFDLGVDVPGPIGFGADQDGELYVLSADGNIVRLIPQP